MSTEANPATRAGARRARRTGRSRRRFGKTFAITLAALVVVGVAGGAVSLGQGPRASSVAVDTEAVAAASGQRIVFTANQPLATVAPEQVSLSPDAPHTVVTSGRHVAVQFTYPLDPDTEYTVTIAGVSGAAGGPRADLAHAFHTGSPPIRILQRRDGDDAIFTSNLAGDEAVPIFSARQIEDFRATRDGLVVATTDDEGNAALTAVDTETGETEPLALPGVGTVSQLQVADHGGLVGYTFTDAAIGTTGSLDTALFLASLDDPAAEPQHIEVGEDPRVQEWAFVPQTSALLVLAFDGQLRMIDTEKPDADPVPLGGAIGIAGIEQGTGRAIIERLEDTIVIDLTTLEEFPLVEPDGFAALGEPGPIAPAAEGATLRRYTQLGDDGYPASQSVVHVDSGGAVTPILDLADVGDVVLQVCASPSGRYAAVLVAPDLVDNPYDRYLRPLPQKLETHIVDVRDGAPVSVLQGSDISWCARSS